MAAKLQDSCITPVTCPLSKINRTPNHESYAKGQAAPPRVETLTHCRVEGAGANVLEKAGLPVSPRGPPS